MILARMVHSSCYTCCRRLPRVMLGVTFVGARSQLVSFSGGPGVASRRCRRKRTMKAVYIERHGGPEELKYGDLPDPVAKPGEVVVDIHAASVNGADWKVRAGQSYPQTNFPYVLGRDFSGVVSAIGPGVRDFAVGDAVFAVCDVGQEGAYAEKIAVKAAIVAHKPTSISHVDAAAVALAGLTALVAARVGVRLRSARA